MPRVNLRGVSTACQRRGCRSGSGKLHRHHTGCQFMFVRHFERSRAASAKYKKFVEDYHAFLEKDIVTICDECHLEIHVLYRNIIGRAVRRWGSVWRWSWSQAYRLMAELDEYCRAWLETPWQANPNYTVQIDPKAQLPSTESRDGSLRRISGGGKKNPQS